MELVVSAKVVEDFCQGNTGEAELARRVGLTGV